MEAQREVMREQREAMQDQKREMERQMMIIHGKKAGEDGRVRVMAIGDLKDLKEMKELKELKKLEDLDESEVEVINDLNGKKYSYSFSYPKWEGRKGESFVWKDGENMKFDIPELKGGVYAFNTENRDVLSIEKELADESSSADFNYEVKQGATSVSLHVNGAINAGKVNIIIKKPNGEVFNEYSLSPLANVNWNQTISFEDLEEGQYVGKWTVTVSADKAKGSYSVRLNGR
jgi:methionine-rich copper-binding protein CopC